MVSEYNREQIETLSCLHRMIGEMDPEEVERLKASCENYLRFRTDVDRFLSRYFNGLCTRQCFEQRLSACCSREGIITFFADAAINTLFSDAREIERLLAVLEGEGKPHKCIYLGDAGCLWRITPIVCAMFLCDRAMDAVFDQFPEARHEWEALKKRRKQFTWPDRPVLFDHLERYFMDAGCTSPLMYYHNSPGLIRVKQMSKKGKKTDI